MEFLFIILFIFLLTSLFFRVARLFEFVVFLEVLALNVIFYYSVTLVSSYDYSLLLNLLMVVSCETAIGLALLVVVVRSFSKDNIHSFFLSHSTCEGF